MIVLIIKSLILLFNYGILTPFDYSCFITLKKDRLCPIPMFDALLLKINFGFFLLIA